ncbi:MAG: erythromycin biosynthesis sensory transduction protein EryC1 [Patescibacteria group bacterium]|nr:MAG: erythromycin biosynthesis sensory transduction protein EryC1 [Patescibacteria group bacterium]
MQVTRSIKYLDFQKEAALRGKKYLAAMRRVLNSGVYILSDEVKRFEQEFADYCDIKYCVGVGNGLEAIQISLMALGIGKGDEVITTPLSAVATTLAILAVGAEPVFVDIKENGQINEDLIEKAITKRTKAVLPVHLYGQPANVKKISDICKKHDLFLVEDCAQAHGTTLDGRKVGTFGDIACWSFYPTKNLGAIGDGGAITTNSPELAKICSEIRDYGQESKYVHVRFGLNSRLDELQAAILREKLKFLDRDNLKRRKIAKFYVDKLKNVKGIEVVLPERFEDSVFHLFVIKTDKRDELKKYLANNGIPTLIHYPIVIPDQPMFGERFKKLDIPVSKRFVIETLSLPMYPFTKNIEANYVVSKLSDFFC